MGKYHSQICGIGSATSIYGKLFDENNVDPEFKSNSERIIGGMPLQNGVFPWAVYLSMGCTGSIISPNYILTAKHCTMGSIGFVKVYYGSANKDNQMSQVSTTMFQFSDGKNVAGEDIALIKLENPIEFNENVSSICLSRNLRPKIGDKAIVAGFGNVFLGVKFNFTKGEDVLEENINSFLPSDLYAVSMPVINSTFCYCHCNTSEKFYDINEEKEFCAGGFQQGTLGGDSGGPFMILEKSSMQWFQAGITARGETLSTGNSTTIIDHGMYTDVSKFCDWIEKTTNNEVLCSD
uniref:Peptidase S1 domain-containing protein n=1 Tax=Panagrolaimus davidi TaxID=227884 RepID=A0A914PNP6_9BILA